MSLPLPFIVNVIGGLSVEDRVSVLMSVLLTAYRVDDLEIFSAMMEKRIQLCQSDEIKRDLMDTLTFIRELMALRGPSRKMEEIAQRLNRREQHG